MEKAESPKKKVWYQEKIEKLEAQIASLQAQNLTVSSQPLTVTVTSNERVEGYADGFVDCMHKYGILSKFQRRRVKENILKEGVGAVKATKRSRFSLSVPSV